MLHVTSHRSSLEQPATPFLLPCLLFIQFPPVASYSRHDRFLVTILPIRGRPTNPRV